MPRRAVGRPSDRLVLLSSCDGRAGRSFRWQRAAGDPVTAPAFDPSAWGGGPTSGPSRRRGGFAPSAWGQRRRTALAASRSALRPVRVGAAGKCRIRPPGRLVARGGGAGADGTSIPLVSLSPGPAGLCAPPPNPALERAEDPATVAGSRDVAFDVAVVVVLES